MTKVAILFPGDMGVHIAKGLIEEGFQVYSDFEDRSEATKKRALDIGIEQMSLVKIANMVSFVISLVPAAAVQEVAQSYLDASADQQHVARFIDMNAKSTEMAQKLAEMFEGANRSFVNACVIGRAAFVKEEGVIYYSGEQIPDLEEELGNVFEMIYLGGRITAATAFKMCFAGFNKTITAVFFEIATAANHFGITDKLFEEISRKMPGTIDDISKIIGNYPKHINRRQQEMKELSQMLAAEKRSAAMSTAAALTFAEVEEKNYFNTSDKEKNLSLMTILKKLTE